RLRMHHTEAAIALLRQGDCAAARRILADGMRYGFDMKANMAYAASYLPHSITRHLPGRLRFPNAGIMSMAQANEASPS
ncbi:MAG: hypothetical protein ABJB22_06120, partial [Verrucomicrobiota bacterium]